MDKIQKVLSGEFCREDVVALLPLAKDERQRQALSNLAKMTATRATSKKVRRGLRVTLVG